MGVWLKANFIDKIINQEIPEFFMGRIAYETELN
jgi:hypothetical protein